MLWGTEFIYEWPWVVKLVYKETVTLQLKSLQFIPKANKNQSDLHKFLSS